MTREELIDQTVRQAMRKATWPKYQVRRWVREGQLPGWALRNVRTIWDRDRACDAG